MNILLLADYYPPDKIGGVGEIARGLAEAYRALGHRVVVLTTGRARPEDSVEGVVRSAARLSLGVLLNNVIALRIVRRERIDLVHLHQSGSTLFLFARVLPGEFPVVITSLQVSYLSEAREIRSVRTGARTFRPTFREYVERYVLAPAHLVLDFIGYALSDRVTVVSQDNRDELRRTFGRLARRDPVVVPNGVAAAPARPSERDPALEARLRERVVVGYTGVFRTRKRVANLVQAMRRVVDAHPAATLLLVGGGRGLEGPLRALARECGVEDHVLFVGPVPADRVPYYQALMDIVCIPSSYEGMPMAMLEAMRAGKPVVATAGFGMRDVLSKGGGVLVPPDDVPALAGALADLVRDPARRAELGRTAGRRAGEFAWDRVARQYLALVDGA